MDKDNLQIIWDHYYWDEVKHLLELAYTETDLELPESIEDVIAFCEKHNYTDHIAYNLAKLKHEIK